MAELNLCSLFAYEVVETTDPPETPLSFEAARLRDYKDSPEFAAYSVRRGFRLPPGPIRSLTQAAEEAGVFIFVFDMGEEVMGLSHWAPHRPPVVCINCNIPGDRYRWTLAHELGHLALHSVESDADTMEKEADQFAAELLMPRDDIAESLRGLTVSKLRELKLDWGVAMQSLLWRARELGLMSEYEMRRHFIFFSKRGWRRKEPESLPVERTDLVQRSRRHLASLLGGGTRELAHSLKLPEDVLARLTSVRHGASVGHLRYMDGGGARDKME